MQNIQAVTVGDLVSSRQSVVVYITSLVAFVIFCLIAAPTIAASKRGVSALGFVEPEGGILHLSGISSSKGAVVFKLQVREGDRIKKGQIIAILDNHEILEATLKQAKAEVKIAQARLDLVKAGSSQSTLKAQKARIDRLKEETSTAMQECKRIKKLRKRGMVSESISDKKCLDEKVFRAQLRESRAILMTLSEVRDVNVAVSLAELHMAEMTVFKAQAELERSVVRTPIDGQILKLHTNPGELIGILGIAEVGQTANMWVTAEVYETDVNRVKVGQSVLISSDGFPGTLHGSVKEIGLTIGKNQLTSDDPTANKDARMVEVKIKLDEKDSIVVSRLTHLQVTVIILTSDKK